MFVTQEKKTSWQIQKYLGLENHAMVKRRKTAAKEPQGSVEVRI